jgi:hypothetical protein
MATLLKVLNNLADIKSAGGVALGLGTQASRDPKRFDFHENESGTVVALSSPSSTNADFGSCRLPRSSQGLIFRRLHNPHGRQRFCGGVALAFAPRRAATTCRIRA